MDANILVHIRNQFGETESEATFLAKSYPAAATKARNWLRKSGIEKPTCVVRTDNTAWWVWRPGSNA